MGFNSAFKGLNTLCVTTATQKNTRVMTCKSTLEWEFSVGCVLCIRFNTL